MNFFTICLICFFLFSCGRASETTVQQKTAETSQQGDAQYKKELEDIKKNIRSDVKVKLKKDGKGTYNWEITGKDVQEVLKVNETLKKRLND